MWNEIITNTRQAKYPSENFIRFVARNYYSEDRSKIHFLDLGCGAGANSWYLAHEGFSVMALDSSEGGLASLKHRIEEERFSADIAYIQADIKDWYFPANEFDCILDNNSLCHIEEPPLKAIHDALKANGKFFSICPTDDTWKGTLENKGYCRTITREQVAEFYNVFSNLKIGRAEYPEGENIISSWIVEVTK